jgi:uncharacterized protein (DUF885 family)
MKSLALLLLLSLPAVADDSAVFNLLLEEHWQRANEEQVFFRMDADAWRFAGKLAEWTPAAIDRRHRYNDSVLTRLTNIDPQKLDKAERVSYQVFLYERETERDAYATPEYLYAITNRGGWHSYFANAPANMSFLQLADYDIYLQSLADYPRYNRENMERLRRAVKLGHTHFCTSMEGFENTISAQIVADIEDSPFYAPLANIPRRLPEREREDIRRQGVTLIKESVIPAYEEFLAFYRQEYAPHCRNKAGISSTPGGDDYYRFAVRFYTTTDLSPREIHELGQLEVQRIRAEMQDIIDATGFEGDFSEFLTFLRTDPRFFTDSAEDLLEKTSRIAKRMDGQLTRLFSALPRLPYDIKPVPDSIAEKTSGAYYVPAPGDGITPGTYFINTSQLASRPLYTLEALSFHEAVPGHHLQTALSLELDLPPFRRILYHAAYGEGWGLYAERLGLEAGFYTDPYSNFGRLTYEIWRACRLVVDTGIHAFGWSRQQAIDYMAMNAGLSRHEITAEVDRYITWPAQALGYKIGELKIRELRARAERETGEAFDLRHFHDTVLGNGSLPLTVLETLVDEWIRVGAARGTHGEEI